MNNPSKSPENFEENHQPEWLKNRQNIKFSDVLKVYDSLVLLSESFPLTAPALVESEYRYASTLRKIITTDEADLRNDALARWIIFSLRKQFSYAAEEFNRTLAESLFNMKNKNFIKILRVIVNSKFIDDEDGICKKIMIEHMIAISQLSEDSDIDWLKAMILRSEVDIISASWEIMLMGNRFNINDFSKRMIFETPYYPLPLSSIVPPDLSVSELKDQLKKMKDQEQMSVSQAIHILKHLSVFEGDENEDEKMISLDLIEEMIETQAKKILENVAKAHWNDSRKMKKDEMPRMYPNHIKNTVIQVIRNAYYDIMGERLRSIAERTDLNPSTNDFDVEPDEDGENKDE